MLPSPLIKAEENGWNTTVNVLSYQSGNSESLSSHAGLPERKISREKRRSECDLLWELLKLCHYLTTLLLLIAINGRGCRWSLNISYEIWLLYRRHTWTIFSLGTIYIDAIYNNQLLRSTQLLTQRNQLIHRSCWILLMGCTISALLVYF